MIRSMTGFGSASLENEALRAAATVRSLNHRFLEVVVHLPRRSLALEPDVRALVQSRLHRGRVEVSVQASLARGEGEQVVASHPLVGALVTTLRAIQTEHRLDGGVQLADIVRFPGTIEVLEAPDEAQGAVAAALLELVGRALAGNETMRRAEGDQLAARLAEGLAAIEAATGRIAALTDAGKLERREALAERVRALVAELGLDDARLYQEAVRQVERSDVTEELQRLASHVAQCRELLRAPEPAGKRLDFLAQELMREANTIGSKAASAGVTSEVVSLKHAIEALREQVQNVE